MSFTIGVHTPDMDGKEIVETRTFANIEEFAAWHDANRPETKTDFSAYFCAPMRVNSGAKGGVSRDREDTWRNKEAAEPTTLLKLDFDHQKPGSLAAVRERIDFLGFPAGLVASSSCNEEQDAFHLLIPISEPIHDNAEMRRACEALEMWALRDLGFDIQHDWRAEPLEQKMYVSRQGAPEFEVFNADATALDIHRVISATGVGSAEEIRQKFIKRDRIRAEIRGNRVAGDDIYDLSLDQEIGVSGFGQMTVRDAWELLIDQIADGRNPEEKLRVHLPGRRKSGGSFSFIMRLGESDGRPVILDPCLDVRFWVSDRDMLTADPTWRTNAQKKADKYAFVPPAAGEPVEPEPEPTIEEMMAELDRIHALEAEIEALEEADIAPADVVAKPVKLLPKLISKFEQLPEKATRREMLVQGLIAVGTKTMISAPPKMGKSTFLAHLIRSFIDDRTGGKLQVGPGRFLRTRRLECVMLTTSEGDVNRKFEAEGIPSTLRSRLHVWAPGVDSKGKYRPGFNFNSETDRRHLLKTIERLGCKIWFHDVLMESVGGLDIVRDELDATVVTDFLNDVAALGCTPVILHHTNSEGRMFGSSRLTQAVECRISLEAPMIKDKNSNGFIRNEEAPVQIWVRECRDNEGNRLLGHYFTRSKAIGEPLTAEEAELLLEEPGKQAYAAYLEFVDQEGNLPGQAPEPTTPTKQELPKDDERAGGSLMDHSVFAGNSKRLAVAEAIGYVQRGREMTGFSEDDIDKCLEAMRTGTTEDRKAEFGIVATRQDAIIKGALKEYGELCLKLVDCSPSVLALTSDGRYLPTLYGKTLIAGMMADRAKKDRKTANAQQARLDAHTEMSERDHRTDAVSRAAAAKRRK